MAFESRQELEQCRRQVGEGWDEDEIYFVYEEILEAFPAMEFEKFSYCAGLLSLQG